MVVGRLRSTLSASAVRPGLLKLAAPGATVIDGERAMAGTPVAGQARRLRGLAGGASE
jgi:hypothetical protein